MDLVNGYCIIAVLKYFSIIVSTGPALQCSEIADARLLLISCFLQGAALDFATCSFDGGAATRCKWVGTHSRGGGVGMC